MTGSSGDLLADRRYAYARAAAAEDDWIAAADLALQCLELAPSFAPAWFVLGEARAAQFTSAEPDADPAALFRDAVSAFERALFHDPADVLGSRLRLAALSVGDPLHAISPGYVTALFDEYATRFDRHLRRSLAYRGPEILHDAVRRAASLRLRDFAFGSALDLGCGTGLAGELFRPECHRLVGVDLSPAMVARAETKRIYDDLHVGEIVRWTTGRPDGSADLVLAADVLVYLGDLQPLFAAVARVLRPGGLFGFTVQANEREGVVLGEDRRYAHSAAYLDEEARRAGLARVLSDPVSTRQDRGRDVPGQVVVLAR